jgi:2-polyprenyl-3-methyl-5-hydroxy-6-metoxy-1,4-benzoquinol methylase
MHIKSLFSPKPNDLPTVDLTTSSEPTVSENFVYRPTCELCGSENKKILLSKQFTDPAVWDFVEHCYKGRINKDQLKGSNYEISKCLKCGFIWQAYIANNEFMKNIFYNVKSSSGNSLNKKKCAGISLFSKYARQAESIALLLSKKPFEIDVLDFGMGWGYWSLMAKAFGYNVSGFEISEERIEFARNRGISVINKFDDLRSQNFDFIYSNQVFEHISNPLQTLKSLVSSLKSKGIIYISVPDGKGIEQQLASPKWKASRNAIHPLEHINCFTYHSLVQLGELAGLVLIKQPLSISLNYLSLKSYIRGFLGNRYTPYPVISLFFKKCK